MKILWRLSWTTVLISAALSVCAQKYDADSVYYTHIPKTVEKKTLQKTDQAPAENDRPVAYFFTIQSGALVGSSPAKEITFTASTLQGVTIGKKFRTGVGLGIDSYNAWQTVPIFGSVSWDLIGTKNSNAIFAQFSYGWAKPSLNESNKEYGYKSVDGGRMVCTQIGYRIHYHNARILFIVGSKFQRVNTYYEYPTILYNNGTPVQGPPSTKTIQEDMSRLMISMAFGWK